MKRAFLWMVVPALLIALGFAQTPAPSAKTEQTNIQGCLGGSDPNYTLVEDNTGFTFKIANSSVDLKPHLGHDVTLIGHKASGVSSAATDNSFVVTELNMRSEHCAAAASIATASTPSETASTPAPTDAAPTSSSAPAETAIKPDAPAATVSTSTETTVTPAVTAATVSAAPETAVTPTAPGATVSAPAETAVTPAAPATVAAATVSATQGTTATPAAAATPPATHASRRPAHSRKQPAMPAGNATPPATPASTPSAVDATPAETASTSSATADTRAPVATPPTKPARGASFWFLIAFAVVVIVIGTMAPLLSRWRKRKNLERTGAENLSFTKEASSEPSKSDPSVPRKAA